MTSPFSDELLSAYLDGELNAEERAYVEAQLRERVELRRLCDELRALRATLQAMPVARPPENFAERVMRQAERQMLADAVPAADQPATADAHSEKTVELHKRSFLASANWRIVIGVVAGSAACALAMVFLFPPSASQTVRSVAVAPDAINLPIDDMAELAADPRSDTAHEGAWHDNRDLLVRGRAESMEFSDGASKPESTALRVEMVPPSAPEQPSVAATAPAAPARHDEPPTGGPTSPTILAAGETDSTARRMRVEDRPAAPAMAGSKLSETTPSGMAGGGAGGFRAFGEGGTAVTEGLGMPSSGLGGGMGGAGELGRGAMPYGTDLRLGKAVDAPADAMPPSQSAANMADDVKFRFSPGLEQAASDASDESRSQVSAKESNAWFGTPVTAETIAQCTTQLDEARFLFVKISLPEGTENEASSSISSYFSRGATVPLELFAKQQLTEGNTPERTPSPQGSTQSHDSFGSDAQLPQQVLVIDGSSELIRQSIDQLVSLPESSVELATSDSAAKQLVEQQLVLEPTRQLGEQLERRKLSREMADGLHSDAREKGVVQADRKADGEGVADHSDPTSEAELAEDKAGAAGGVSLGRFARTAGDQSPPPPAAQPQDPAPVAASPAESTPAHAETMPVDRAMSQPEQSTDKPSATLTDEEVAKKRVVFYVLYRLVPNPVPPAPADDAGGR